MKKIVAISTFMIVVAFSIISYSSKNYFQQSSNDGEPSIEISKKLESSSSESNPTPTNNETNYRVALEPAPDSDDHQQAQEHAADESTPMLRMPKILSAGLRAEGFSEEIGECIMSLGKSNLSREKPLSFDELSDSCSDKIGVADHLKAKVREIFRESIDKSQSILDFQEWYKCASTRKIEGPSCFTEHYQEILQIFYEENRGESKISSVEIKKRWSKMIDDNMGILAQNCKELDSQFSFTQMFANECSIP